MKKQIFFVLIVSLVFMGCNGGLPMYRHSSHYHQSIKEVETVALIIDTCVTMDEVFTDYILVDESTKIASIQKRVISKKFAESGITLQDAKNNTVCAYRTESKLDMQIKINGDVKEVEVPYFYKKTKGKKYRKALEQVLKHTDAVTASNKNFDKNFFSDKSIIKSLKIIKNKTGQSKLLIILNKIHTVSTGEKAWNIANAITLSPYKTIANKDYIITKALLIDIDKSLAFWTASIKFYGVSVYDENYYETHYYDGLLKSLVKDYVQKQKGL